ncbi:hypothetical protein ACWHA6_36215 [Streptomyces anthocyanicus]
MGATDRTAWWSTCSACSTNLVIYPHPERDEDVPHPNEWEEFWPDCPVCAEPMRMEGSDPVRTVFR